MEREDLTVRVMKDMDPELLDFLDTYVDSFITWDLLHFFHENPHTMDTGENIARYAGRAVRDVEPELKALAKRGVLEEITSRNLQVYKLTSDSELQAQLARFVKATKDREFRRKAIYHLVRR